MMFFFTGMWKGISDNSLFGQIYKFLIDDLKTDSFEEVKSIL